MSRQWADFNIKNHEFDRAQCGQSYARRIFDLRVGDRAHGDRGRLHARNGGLPRAAARDLSLAQTEIRRAGLIDSMKPADICIAVMVAIIWGLAFVASRIALDEFSPELMTALRFAVAAVPCLFVRKPDVSWPVLISISSTLFLGQFLAQAYGIAHGVPVGLSSVIVQSQALFTIGLAAVIFRERPSPAQTIGIGYFHHRTVDDLRHCRLRFQRRRVRDPDDLSDQLRDRQSVAAAGQPRANVRPVCMDVSCRRATIIRADVGRQRT